MSTSRRQFLTTAIGSTAVLAVGARPPQFLLNAAAAEPPTGNDSILVVVELSGGNDGLNTIVPYADDEYRKNRPQLGIGESSVLRIDDYCGFHPSLRGFAELLEKGELAIVQGVGYPNPNRSHFESMDIWHTCHQDKQQRADGWLGRYLDAAYQNRGVGIPAMHFGSEKQPLALAAQRIRVPSLQSLDSLQLKGDQDELTAIGELTSAGRAVANPLLGFVQSSSTAALSASERVRSRLQKYEAESKYPESSLANKLQLVAQLIDAGMETRVFYVALDGFDTHSQQSDAHAGLLRQLGDAVQAFLQDVSAHDHGDRVLVTAFSEFGRRVQENASAGTDHGAAAPMFCAGSRVRAGLHGAHPSLTDLQEGDLKHHTDFRQVYATILEDWLAWKSRSVLDGPYETLPLIKGQT